MKLSVTTWRSLNIKRNAFLQVVKMQEGVTMTGNIKSKILHSDALIYCKHCYITIASISHILLGCYIMKNNQILKHEYVCKQIYKHILITYFNKFNEN